MSAPKKIGTCARVRGRANHHRTSANHRTCADHLTAISRRKVGARSCARSGRRRYGEEDQRVAALEAAERAERDAIAAILTGAAFMPSVVAEDDGDIPMFPIDAPPMYAHPSGGESPPHQVRRVSYLID